MVDPVTLGAAGQFLGGLGSLAGGLFGGGKGGPTAFEKNNDWRLATEAIQIRARDAKAAGVHPLYAMGQPGLGTMPHVVDGQSYMGERVEQGLKGAGKALSALSIARQQSELVDAEILERSARALEALSAARMNDRNFVSKSAAGSVVMRADQALNSRQDFPHFEVLRSYKRKTPHQDLEDYAGGTLSELDSVADWVGNVIRDSASSVSPEWKKAIGQVQRMLSRKKPLGSRVEEMVKSRARGRPYKQTRRGRRYER